MKRPAARIVAVLVLAGLLGWFSLALAFVLALPLSAWALKSPQTPQRDIDWHLVARGGVGAPTPERFGRVERAVSRAPRPTVGHLARRGGAF